MQIAGYTLGRLLAQGVSGETYFAEDLRGQRVVLKLVAEPLSATVGFRERFRRDSDRLASFEHAHIVGIREVGEVDGRLFVVSDRVECTDLAALLARDGPLMTERALQIAEQAASALHAARWGRGVVHGNLKPTNILVDDGDAVDHVWLTDFGLWTVVDSRAREAAERGPATDTEYRAPELLAGEEPTTLSDQYALGSILHECLMGARPGSQRAPLPAGLGEAIARARAASPEERYSTAPEFIAAARRPPARSPEPAGLLQRSDLWERPRVAADPVPPDSRPTAGREPAASTGMARHRRRWHLVAVGVMLALAALAAAVAVLTRSSAPSEPEVRTLSLGRPAPPAGDERASPRERAETSVQLAPGSLARIDPQSSQLTPIDAGLGDVKLTVAVGEGTVWAFERDGPSTVAQIDPETNALVRTVEIVGRPRDVAIADGSVWVASSVRGDGVLVEIAAATGRLQRTIDLGYSGVMAIAVGAGSVWIAAAGAQGNLALRIDPTTGEVIAAIAMTNRPSDIAAGAGAVWLVGGRTEALQQRPGTVWRADPSTDAVVASLTLPGRASSPQVTRGAGGVWVAADHMFRIDPATNQIAETIRGRSRVAGVAVGRGSVWAVNRQQSSVRRIDPETNRVVETIAINGGCGCSVAVGAGGVWAS